MAGPWEVLKSTIDKIVRDAAAGLVDVDTQVTEVEDATAFEAVLKNEQTAIVYQVARLSDSPRPPKFDAAFNVGVKTTNDGNNNTLTKILSNLTAIFAADERFALHDYSGEDAGPQRGAMLLTSADVTPQQFDKKSGMRLISCSGKVVCSAG